MPGANFSTAASYLRCHRWRWVAAGGVVLIADVIISSTHEVSVPAANHQGYVTIPLWLQVPLIMACLIPASLTGSMASLEETASISYRRFELRYIIAASGISVLAVGLTAAIAGNPSTAVVLVRALLIWLGISLLSGRIFGWNLSWVLPLISFFPLNYYGADMAGNFYWWYWPRQPAGSAPCALIALVSIVLGSCAVACTKWRLSAVRQAIGNREHRTLRRSTRTQTTVGSGSARRQ